MRTIRELLQELRTSSEQGLAPHAVGESARRFGRNRLTPLPRPSLWLTFLAKFDEPIIKILLAAALLSMTVELWQSSGLLGSLALGLLAAVILPCVVASRGRQSANFPLPAIMFALGIALFFFGLFNQHILVEGLAVMVAVILATGVAFASEYRSDREFEVLNAQTDGQCAKVVRGGEFQTIPAEDVVVGDVIFLETGDEVPADGRVLKATELYVDQALMTGESEPAYKQPGAEDDISAGPDQPACLYRGTQVVDGVGQMLVTEVGDFTALGEMARRLSVGAAEDISEPGRSTSPDRVKAKLTISKELTPLQVKLHHLAGVISKVGYAAAILIFLAQLLHGIFAGKVFWPTDSADLVSVVGVLLAYVINMVIVIVVAVPEGLPMSVTVSLALAMRKMTRANSLVRQLAACETIGSATVICTDKTGTLTKNKMEVVHLGCDGQTTDRGASGWMKFQAEATWPPAPGSPPEWIAFNAAINSTARLETKEGKPAPVGNSTEGALLRWLHESGLEYQPLRLRFEPCYQIHFSSERKRMTTVIRAGGRLLVLAKGSPEWMMANSTLYLTADGSVSRWTPQARQAVELQLQSAAAAAMRTLAFGHAYLSADMPNDKDALHARREALETDLVYEGFVGIRDPLRDDVQEALARCRDAGIAVKMVTGDNVETARAIAFEIGLIDRRDSPINLAGGMVMTSDYFGGLEDEELKSRLPKLRVLARAKPLDKFRLVTSLQELGEVVAVTGDGTNDAPALKKADVGLAMGITGTAVAKEASKIVLLDDSFATIVKAVHWGRALYENIQRFLQFQLTINLSALATYLLGILFFQVEAPFTVLQLLWINVIMDTLASIALCSEPPRPGLMAVPPKKRDESIITPAMATTILSTSAFFVVVMLWLLVALQGAPTALGWLGNQEGLFFSVYVFFQVWNQINCRSLTPTTSGLSRIWHNPLFLAVAGTVAIGQIIIVTFGGPLFKVQPLDPLTWLYIIVGTSSVLVFAEVARRIRVMMRQI